MRVAAVPILWQVSTRGPILWTRAGALERAAQTFAVRLCSGGRPQCSATIYACKQLPASIRSFSDSSKPSITNVPGKSDESKPATTGAPVDAVLEGTLPSESVSRRHALSVHLSRSTDRLLESLASTSQRLNEYTGTDYTGIAALRSDIRAQELAVKELLEKVADAKAAHDAALAAQGASQKEVVQLLERKHSWADGDLERYMALIRNEHEHESAVKSALEALRALERELEDARGRLERKERKQYHEEQVWSDTIRRNSTWVTFGLMGFNVFLLLANVVIIEPWRRRRLVRELKSEMDERLALTVTAATGAEQGLATQIDEVIPPQSVTAEGLQEASLLASEVKAEQLQVLDKQQLDPSTTGYAASIGAYLGDFFSDRLVTFSRLDVTAIALESAVAGAAVGSVLVLLFRS